MPLPFQGESLLCTLYYYYYNKVMLLYLCILSCLGLIDCTLWFTVSLINTNKYLYKTIETMYIKILVQ